MVSIVMGGFACCAGVFCATLGIVEFHRSSPMRFTATVGIVIGVLVIIGGSTVILL